MRYAGIHEFLAVGHAAMSRVEGQRVGLGIEMHRGMSLLARAADQEFKDRTADATPPPLRHDRLTPRQRELLQEFAREGGDVLPPKTRGFLDKLKDLFD